MRILLQIRVGYRGSRHILNVARLAFLVHRMAGNIRLLLESLVDSLKSMHLMTTFVEPAVSGTKVFETKASLVELFCFCILFVIFVKFYQIVETLGSLRMCEGAYTVVDSEDIEIAVCRFVVLSLLLIEYRRIPVASSKNEIVVMRQAQIVNSHGLLIEGLRL